MNNFARQIIRVSQHPIGFLYSAFQKCQPYFSRANVLIFNAHFFYLFHFKTQFISHSLEQLKISFFSFSKTMVVPYYNIFSLKFFNQNFFHKILCSHISEILAKFLQKKQFHSCFFQKSFFFFQSIQQVDFQFWI